MPLGAWKSAKARVAAMTIARAAVQLGNISLLSLIALAKTAPSGHLRLDRQFKGRENENT